VSIVELNIGLGTDPGKIGARVGHISAWLGYRRPTTSPVFSLRVISGGDEFVLLVRTAFKSSKGLFAFEDLARELRQDCIAVWDVDTRIGYLIGPSRLDWGDFDIKKFKRIKS
jgi:hypothetical protein